MPPRMKTPLIDAHKQAQKRYQGAKEAGRMRLASSHHMSEGRMLAEQLNQASLPPIQQEPLFVNDGAVQRRPRTSALPPRPGTQSNRRPGTSSMMSPRPGTSSRSLPNANAMLANHSRNLVSRGGMPPPSRGGADPDMDDPDNVLLGGLPPVKAAVTIDKEDPLSVLRNGSMNSLSSADLALIAQAKADEERRIAVEELYRRSMHVHEETKKHLKEAEEDRELKRRQLQNELGKLNESVNDVVKKFGDMLKPAPSPASLQKMSKGKSKWAGDKYANDGSDNVNLDDVEEYDAMQSTNETYSERLARLKRMDVVAKQKLREMAARPGARPGLTEYNHAVLGLKQKVYEKGKFAVCSHFQALDGDNSGVLERDEFINALEGFNLGISKKTCDRLMHAIDKDGSGSVDYNEFCDAIRHNKINFEPVHERMRMGPDPDLPFGQPADVAAPPWGLMRDADTNLAKFDANINARYNNIKDTFQRMDLDKSGEIDKEEFDSAMGSLNKGKWKQCKLHLSPNEIKRLFQFADKDKSGAVSYDEFIKSFQPPGEGKVRFLPEFLKPKSNRRSQPGHPWAWVPDATEVGDF